MFREVTNSFQNKLKADIRQIKNEPKIFMKADKTTNYYKVEVEKAEELVEKEIHKVYKKATPKIVADIKSEAVSLATELGVEDRLFATTENQAYNLIKDHKEDFRNNPQCRQINPCRPELGKVCKFKLDTVLDDVRKKSGLVQFKNDQEFLDWFNNIENKEEYTFYQWDIC